MSQSQQKLGQSYKLSHTLEERKKRVSEQLQKYPDMIPIIVEKQKNCKLPELQRIKFLVNSGFTFHEFKTTIRKKLNLDEKTSTLFIYCGQTLINEDSKLQVLYDQYKDKDDGFLYLQYTDSELTSINHQMDILPYDDKIFYDTLGMRLWERRHQHLDQFITNQRILDIGCNDGKFIERQSHSTDLELIVGLDIDQSALEHAKTNILSDQLQDCIKPNRLKRCQIQLYQGDAFKKYQTLKDTKFELITLIEVIEHVFLEQLPQLCENVFGYLNAPTIIITTPNADFNVYFKEQDKNFKLRHHDHKYEFTRDEFINWSNAVAQQYNYTVEYSGVGRHRNGDMQYGYASQVAVFRQIQPNQLEYIVDDNDIQLVLDYQCPFDGRSPLQKYAQDIIYNYMRYSLSVQNDVTDMEHDYLDAIESNQILIRIGQLYYPEQAEQLTKIESKFQIYSDNYLLLTI